MPAPLCRDSDEDSKKTNEQVLQDRFHQIDAAIVRIMKVRCLGLCRTPNCQHLHLLSAVEAAYQALHRNHAHVPTDPGSRCARR